MGGYWRTAPIWETTTPYECCVRQSSFLKSPWTNSLLTTKRLEVLGNLLEKARNPGEPR